MRAERRTVRANLASEEARLKRRPGDAAVRERVNQLRAEYRALALEDHIREVVNACPPLSQSQKDRLAVLLQGAA